MQGEHRVNICLENCKMSGNFTAVRELSQISVKIKEILGKNLVRGK